ncbi:fimbria/pilus periplasmic chaperone [Ramlibacter sp. PS3R-8]|uniref:fimbrial biogenesis chaperone n=1 Tax=Ramlibacter sp. PS3R-8 TaxID=3133437 RepID=UPI0030A8C3C2
MMSIRPASRRLAHAAGLLLAACAAGPAIASDFSVSPVRVELRQGALSETITVMNHAAGRLRVSVKLMEWTQDEQGNDIYKESGDIVYFPRQLEVEAEGRRLVRVGAKAPAGTTERTYRVFIEEQPEPSADGRNAQIAVYFRFGVPIFLPPAVPRMQADVGEPSMDKGKLSLQVRNGGNQHFRVIRLVVDDGAGHQQEIAGWYSLAGTQKTYTLDIPADVCRRAKTLNVTVEGEGVRADRKLDVDPARCL